MNYGASKDKRCVRYAHCPLGDPNLTVVTPIKMRNQCNELPFISKKALLH